MLVLASCSALAGVYSEVLIKTGGLPLQASNAWLYAYATAASLLVYLHSKPPNGSLLDGYTPCVWAVVATNSLLGLVISFIFKHGDNIVKLFGASLAVLFTAAVSAPLFNQHPGSGLWLGYGLAACSLCIYYGDQHLLFSMDSDALPGSALRSARQSADLENPKLV